MTTKQMNQATLQRQTEIFISNAADEELSAILATSGCNAACLAEGTSLLKTWQAARARINDLEGDQETATETQEAARTAARAEMNDLTTMIRGEFGHNRPLLKKLGLIRRAKHGSDQPTTDTTQPTENGQSAPTANDQNAPPPNSDNAPSDEATPTETKETGKRRSGPKGLFALAADVVRWRILCTNLKNLSKAELDQLAGVGWDETRRAEAADLVEAVAEADNAQQGAIQTKQAGVAEAAVYEKQLRAWYRRAVRLAKSAIKRHDPTNQSRWLKRLGL